VRVLVDQFLECDKVLHIGGECETLELSGGGMDNGTTEDVVLRLDAERFEAAVVYLVKLEISLVGKD
jgi:hypothetical protein